MLKGIPPVISPDLMQVLMQMGHGDDLVLADGNFPADSNCQRLVRADGLDTCTLLEAILQFFPIDTFVEEVACVMQPVDPETPEPPVWSRYRALLQAAEGREIPLTQVSRDEFYHESRHAYAIVATSDRALYANLMIKKGVVLPEA